MEEKNDKIEDVDESEDFVLNFGDIIIPEPETQPTLPCDFKDRNGDISPYGEKNIENFFEETCYHEASHYVMGIIIGNMKGFNFEFPSSIIVNIRKGEKFKAEVSYGDDRNIIYNQDNKDTDAKLMEVLNLASGYTSHLVFTDTRLKNFIISPEYSDESEVLYSVVKYRARFISDFYERIDIEKQHDIPKIIKLLVNILFYKTPSKPSEFGKGINSKIILESIIDELARFMCLHLKEPIQYVADFLKENNGKKIEGEELKTLQNKVSEMTKDVNLNELTEVIWEKIDEVVEEHKSI